MYIKSKDGKSFKPFDPEDTSNHVERLPAGLYDLKISQGMFTTTIYFEANEDKESYIEPLANKTYVEIKDEVDNSCNPKIAELYKDMQYINKKGVVVYGPPGTGKTVLVKLIAKAMCEKYDAIAIQIDPNNSLHANIIGPVLKSLREVEKDRTIIVIHDECEVLFRNYESSFVTLLDGKDSINNFVYIGITNFIEKIGTKFKDRPSRIKLWKEIDVVPTEVCKALLEAKIPEKYKSMIDIAELAYNCEELKLTIDQIKSNVLCKLEGIVLGKKVLNYTSTPTNEVEEEEEYED